MDTLDRALLNLIQTDFPIVVRPYAAIATRLGQREVEVIERIGRLKHEGLIREISAIFDSARLGYRSVLVAMEVPPARLQEVGEEVAANPGVSHCYGRDHRFNLWYTLTVPPGSDPDAGARAIQQATKVERSIVLPSLHRFKIGVNFDLSEEDERTDPDVAPELASDVPSSTSIRPAVANGSEGRRQAPALHDVTTAPSTQHALAGPGLSDPLSDLDRGVVRELQHDLPLEPRPFRDMAARLGITEARLLRRARALQTRGLMRRYAAVLRHRAAGFLGNGMSCWIVPPEQVEEIGRAMAEWPAVTHCYERPTFPDWPYSLFGMIHSRTAEECLAEASALSAHLGISDYTVLFSHQEFKKERVRYFEESYQPSAVSQRQQTAQ